MGIQANAFPILALGVPNAQLAYLEFTVASGVVTAVRKPAGWTLADFSSGVAALTFPKHFAVMFPFEGQENTDDANATSRHRLMTKTIDVAAGTASVRVEDNNDGTTENPVDGTFRLLYLVGD